MESEAYQAVLEDLKRRRIPAEVKEVVRAMLDKQAQDVVVLKIKDISDVTDYMVIAHGNSTRQNLAVADEVKRRLRRVHRLKTTNVEGEAAAEWILLDYFDFVVHVFTRENRRKFALEKLWMDAKQYHFSPN
ncbi:MAG: ribosome silencing factor [Acidobacteriota bacterium]|jgi:ribosome-associated protein|nr:ribosome silencing factor [Acidobacteriota bacterium]